MQKELDCLRGDLESAKARIKFLQIQTLAKDLELQRAKAELDWYDPKYRKPEPELVRERKQCRNAQQKRWEEINQWYQREKTEISNEGI